MLKQLFLYTILVLSYWFTPKAKACGPDYDPEYSYYYFFDQKVIPNDKLYGFLYQSLSTRMLANYGISEDRDPYEYRHQDSPPPSVEPYTAEWNTYLGNKSTPEDIKAVLYDFKKEWILTLSKDIKKLNQSTLPEEVKKNSFVQVSRNKNLQSIWIYLAYARKCQLYAEIQYSSWDDEPTPTIKVMEALIQEGEKLIKKEKSEFLRRRYAYQLVRMAHYSKHYEWALQYYNNYAKPVQKGSYIDYRTIEQIGGVEAALGMEAESAYHFSLVFDKAPDRRKVALRSFRLSSDENWKKASDLCQNNDEKILLHTLRGLQKYGNAVEEMQNIYRLNPNSPYLNLLLVRHINRWERIAFDSDAITAKFPNKPIKENVQDMQTLLELCLKLRETDNIKYKDIWTLAAAHLQLFLGKQQKSAELLRDIPYNEYIKKDKKDPLHKIGEQAIVLNFVRQLCRLDEINDEIENKFYEQFKSTPALANCQDLRPFLLDVFSVLYYRNGDYAKSYLCHNKLDRIHDILDIKLIQSAQKLIRNRQELSPLFKDIFAQHGLKRAYAKELIYWEGTYYLQHNQLEKADKTFSQLSDDFFEEMDGKEPKTTYLNKSIFTSTPAHQYFESDFDSGVPIDKLYQNSKLNILLEFEKDGHYTKKSLTKLLLELEKQAQKKPKYAALYYYALGCAWNNMSPYGWNRPAIYLRNSDNYGYSNYWMGNSTETADQVNVRHSYFREDKDKSKPLNYKHYYSHLYYDPNIAIDYFEKAINTSNDQELKAKACFMAAKAETFKYYSKEYTYSSYYYNRRNKSIQNYQTYYEIMYKEYKDTEYYKEVIRACEHFEFFVSTYDR
ncbi:MAG: hypothetical protein MK212_04440 [Saprospiraceae bacterium]|nr:hypothetical protein [Saprospiraceae bacterium]